MYQGAPKVDLTAVGGVGTPPGFDAELAKEEKNIQDDLNEFKFYPVVAIGLSYRF